MAKATTGKVRNSKKKSMTADTHEVEESKADTPVP